MRKRFGNPSLFLCSGNLHDQNAQGWECCHEKQVNMAKAFAKAFYHSRMWRDIRESILRRDKYLCCNCGRPAEEVHHIVEVTPENIGDQATHAEGNLIALCRDCHCRQHDAKRTGRKEPDYEFDANGFPVMRV